MEEMKKAGIIVTCDGDDTEWASPIVLVKKTDRSTRFCVDFRRLNQVTRKATHPLPRTDDTLAGLSGQKCFTCIDIKHTIRSASTPTTKQRPRSSCQAMEFIHLLKCRLV